MAKLTRKEKIALQKQEGRPTTAFAVRQEQNRIMVKKWLALLVAIAGFLYYSNTLNHEYVLDDFGLIKDNTITKKGFDGVGEIFKNSYRYGMNITDYSLYRPLSKAMFAVEWGISPDSPALGHWINVLMFAFLCFSIFHMLSRYMNGDMLVPFITAMLFAAHPIHTEVVANIKSRDEILCLLLLTGSLILLHTYVKKDSMLSFAGGIFLFFWAFFAKESAITFFVVIPMMYYFFTNATSKKYFQTMSAMAVCIAIFLYIRSKILGDVETLIPVEDNSLAGIKDILLQKANAIYIMGIYLGKLFVPVNLVSDASYNTFPPVGLGSWQFLVPFVVFTGALVYAIARFKKKDPISFCILFFFITASLVSNVVVLIGTNYGERLMFVPSLGICMLVAILLSKFLKTESAEEAADSLKLFLANNSKPILITIGIMVMFGVQTLARNMDWKNNTSLYTTDVKKVPNSAHMLFYLANHITTEEYLEALPDSASRQKNRHEAIDYLTRAVTIFPKYADGYQRRGFIFVQLGDSAKGEMDYKSALQYNPTHPIVYNNYGTLCFNQRRFDEAFSHFQNAVKYNPNYAHALNNLASVYGVFGQGEAEVANKSADAGKAEHGAKARQNYETAITYFLKSIQADPEFGEPYRLAAITYRNIGDNSNGDKYDRLYKEVMARNKK